MLAGCIIEIRPSCGRKRAAEKKEGGSPLFGLPLLHKGEFKPIFADGERYLTLRVSDGEVGHGVFALVGQERGQLRDDAPFCGVGLAFPLGELVRGGRFSRSRVGVFPRHFILRGGQVVGRRLSLVNGFVVGKDFLGLRVGAFQPRLDAFKLLRIPAQKTTSFPPGREGD